MKSEISVRFTELEDALYLKESLMEPEVLQWFPMADEREVDYAVRIWIGYSKWKAGLTALWNGEPCGFSVLYLHPYKKIAHQCLFGVVVRSGYQGKGVGTRIIEETIKLAKESFKIEVLHLEVYQKNPAKRLYERMGFSEYGFDKDFIKIDGQYVGKTCMQKMI